MSTSEKVSAIFKIYNLENLSIKNRNKIEIKYKKNFL
jgi:hypothetical protein